MSRWVFSLDLETTGLNPETCQILEIACLAWDLDNPGRSVDDLSRFHVYVDNGPTIHGEPFAFSMHTEILRRIANGDKGFIYLPPDVVAESLRTWIKNVQGNANDGKQLAHAHFAGKNFGAFDFQFLKKLPNWGNWIRAAHRSFDPAVLYFDPLRDDRLPDMDTCCKRARLLESRRESTLGGPIGEGSASLTTKHDAIGDAKIVIRLLKAKFFPLLRND